MKRRLWAVLLVFPLVFFLGTASPAGAAETMTLSSLGLTVRPPAGYVVLRESVDKDSGEIRVIIETREADSTQFFLRADPLGKKENVQFSAMDEEELRAFLRGAGIGYADARGSLLTLGSGKTALEVVADEGRYYALYVAQDGILVSAAVSANAQALTESDRQALAELLESMRWQPESKNAAGAALQRNARLFARYIYGALDATAAPRRTAVPGAGDADVSFP